MIGVLLLPLAVYLLSYLYLAWFHREIWLFGTIVHESGRYTLFETTFFASHFLGHIPVHTALGFFFAGLCLNFYGAEAAYDFQKVSKHWLMILVFYLLATLAFSFAYFGWTDTIAFIMQNRQRAGSYTDGGAWNLHLPSTLLMFLLIPPSIAGASILARKPLSGSHEGDRYIYIGLAITLLMTILVNFKNPSLLYKVALDPRYQGHSVREIVTFSTIYLPLPLYFVFRGVRPRDDFRHRFSKGIALSLLLFLAIFIFQIVFTLRSGVGGLTQMPVFAGEKPLPMLYLLASHFFEHFLDTIYFLLLCALLLVKSTNSLNGVSKDRQPRLNYSPSKIEP